MNLKPIEHIWHQPLHVTLKQYRLMAIASILFLARFMERMWSFYEVNASTLSAEAAAAFFTFAAAVLGAFVKAINNIREKHEE